MADISQIKLPDGNTYDIKDTTARSLINGIFVLAWNGAAAPTVGNIPAGVQVVYEGTTYTGTLAAGPNNDPNKHTLGKIYLVKSATLPDDDSSDIYNEYVTVDNGSGANPRYGWEKLGDTRIKLGNIVTNVTLDTTNTATVIGTNSTMKVKTAPTYTVTPSTTYVKGTASGASVSYSPDTDTFLKKITPTSKKLQITTVIGVQSSVATASKATQGDSVTAATGGSTTSSSTDAWIKGWSVSGELLTLGGATMNTQQIPQYTFSDVDVPKKNNSATTVANGSLVATSTTTNVGDTIVESVTSSGSGYTANAITSLGNATVTQPTITLSTSGTETTGSTAVAAASAVNATNTNVGEIDWNSKDSKTVLLNTTSITVTKAT